MHDHCVIDWMTRSLKAQYVICRNLRKPVFHSMIAFRWWNLTGLLSSFAFYCSNRLWWLKTPTAFFHWVSSFVTNSTNQDSRVGRHTYTGWSFHFMAPQDQEAFDMNTDTHTHTWICNQMQMALRLFLSAVRDSVNYRCDWFLNVFINQRCFLHLPWTWYLRNGRSRFSSEVYKHN